MKRQFSAGGAVFKKVHSLDKTGDILWLVIKPRPSKEFPKERYQLPKGLLEEKEKTENAALREVFEETGIKGEIVRKIADSRYVFSLKGEKIFKVVSYYLMKYLDGEPKENEEVEKIFWLPFFEASNKLTYSSDKQILKKASEMLQSVS